MSALRLYGQSQAIFRSLPLVVAVGLIELLDKPLAVSLVLFDCLSVGLARHREAVFDSSKEFHFICFLG